MSHINFNYNDLQEWSKKDLIEHVLLLQDHIEKVFDYYNYNK